MGRAFSWDNRQGNTLGLYEEVRFPTDFSSDYYCRYIASYIANKQLPQVRPQLSGIELQTLDEFILQDVLPTLRRYTHKSRTVPEGLWLLGLLSHLDSKNILVQVS